MKQIPEENKYSPDKSESFLNDIHGRLVNLSDAIGAYLHKFNNSDLHSSIDLQEVLSEFREREIHTVDEFCVDYLEGKIEKEGLTLSINENIKNFRALRKFIYEERKKGTFKHPPIR